MVLGRIPSLSGLGATKSTSMLLDPIGPTIPVDVNAGIKRHSGRIAQPLTALQAISSSRAGEGIHSHAPSFTHLPIPGAAQPVTGSTSARSESASSRLPSLSSYLRHTNSSNSITQLTLPVVAQEVDSLTAFMTAASSASATNTHHSPSIICAQPGRPHVSGQLLTGEASHDRRKSLAEAGSLIARN
jgi:hypothetical protein